MRCLCCLWWRDQWGGVPGLQSADTGTLGHWDLSLSTCYLVTTGHSSLVVTGQSQGGREDISHLN